MMSKLKFLSSIPGSHMVNEGKELILINFLLIVTHTDICINTNIKTKL